MLGEARKLALGTNEAFSRAHGDLLAGALAFQGVLSMAPLLVIAVAIAGLAFGPEAARGELERNLTGTVGAAGARTISELITATSAQRAGPLATVLGTLGVLLGASGLFGQLQATLNQVWGVRARVPAGFRGMAGHVLGKRLVAFGFVLLVGMGLVALLVAKTALAATTAELQVLANPAALQLGELGASIAVETGLFTVLFRFLPDGTLAWRHAFWGALVSAVGVSVATFGVGLYLAHVGAQSTYGAAGSVTAILLWAFVSSYVFFWGASFTVAHACTFGQGVTPESHASLIPGSTAAEAAAMRAVAERHTRGGHAAAWPLHTSAPMQGRTRTRDDWKDDSTWAAVARVAEAGTKVVADRIDLARVDVVDKLERTVAQLALALAAGAVALIAWLAGMAALYLVLDDFVGKAISLAVVAGINAILALVLFGVMARTGRKPPSIAHDVDADTTASRPELMPGTH